MRRTLMSLSTIVLTILLAGGLALVAVSPAARPVLADRTGCERPLPLGLPGVRKWE